MIRKIIKIDQDKCNGCGACAAACHEGAIEMIDGKAKLTLEHHCDGLGDCLPACPTGAISFEEREAPAYDEEAVNRAKREKAVPHSGGCPGIRARKLTQSDAPEATNAPSVSRLAQWPCQIKLMHPNAPYLEGADLLVAADCAAYAYGRFHEDFMNGRITLIGCPKLDACDYAEKLTAIIASNNIRSVTLARMEVPCCGGLECAVVQAIEASSRDIPLRKVVISTDGRKL